MLLYVINKLTVNPDKMIQFIHYRRINHHNKSVYRVGYFQRAQYERSTYPAR